MLTSATAWEYPYSKYKGYQSYDDAGSPQFVDIPDDGAGTTAWNSSDRESRRRFLYDCAVSQQFVEIPDFI
jgi:hypothetical protein